MYTIKYILLISCCFFAFCTEEKPEHPLHGKNYQLVFEDNFEADTLDRSKWQTNLFNPKPFDRISPRGSCNFNNSEIFLDRNINLSDGLLKLIAKKELYTYSGVTDGACGENVGCNFNGCDSFIIDVKYTSGSISSKLGYNHGYFECRAKIPSAKGLYPAFWLWHHDEIVVFEFFGNPNNHYLSLHNKAEYVTDNFKEVNDYSKDFHIYAVEWTPFQVTWFFDHKPIRTDYKYLDAASKMGIPEAEFDPEKAFTVNRYFPDSEDRWLHANFSLRVYEYAPVIDEQKFPDTLFIDYVKIYQNQSK